MNEKQVQTRGCSAFQGNHKSDTSPKTFVRSKSFVLTQSSLAAKFEKKNELGKAKFELSKKCFGISANFRSQTIFDGHFNKLKTGGRDEGPQSMAGLDRRLPLPLLVLPA